MYYGELENRELMMSGRTSSAWRLLVGGSWFKWSASQTCCSSSEDKTVAVVIAVYSCKQLQVKHPPPPKKKKVLGLQRDLNPWSLRKCYVQCSTNWTTNPHIWGRGQFVEFILTCERYEINYQDVLYFHRSQHLDSLYLHLSKSFTFTFFMEQLTDQLD